MTKRAIMGLTVLLVAGLFLASGQEQDVSAETESRISELDAFHEIIYPIWHTAYPEKDIEALKGFVPEINELAAKVYAAKLPGILRDKEAKWKAGLVELKQAVEAYNGAAKGNDDKALLDAAEDLHAKYEMLVRTIRPVLKEVDEFHKVLYVVFHEYLPEEKWEDIRGAAPDLKAKAEAVTNATLSSRLESKADVFKAAAEDLLKAAVALEKAGAGGDGAAIKQAVLELHTKYQDLEKIFD